MSLRSLLYIAIAVRFVGVSAANAAVPNSLHHGLAANEVLSVEGLAPSGSIEGMYATGFKAQMMMQGLKTGDRPAVRAEREKESEKGVPSVGKAGEVKKGLRTSEPPAPNVPLPGRADDKEPAKEGRGKKVLKFIMKWLPIAMLYYGSINMIINPVGAAAGALRMVAVIALIGTGMMLYKMLKKKKARKKEAK